MERIKPLVKEAVTLLEDELERSQEAINVLGGAVEQLSKGDEAMPALPRWILFEF